jgi:DNA-binding transcriptional ArsR family regulator
VVDNQGKRRRSSEPDPLDRIFHALSDPSRRQIVEILREAGELRVGDIAETFAMSLNAVSKHLKVLESAGLVRRRVEGREHFICVVWSTLELPHAWLDFHRHFWTRRLDALADHVYREEHEE